jgi:hypothetical protein
MAKENVGYKEHVMKLPNQNSGSIQAIEQLNSKQEASLKVPACHSATKFVAYDWFV